jgi:hypothetical protein
MSKKLFPYLIALTALSVSTSAAYYSVTGLSKLFAGASLAVMIMAGSLEVAKLVIATILHQYWTTMNKVLRLYLTLATIILILITSAGIYGFLSSAYQETATKSTIVDKQVELLESRKSSFEKIKTQYETEKQSITENISNLRNALGNNTQSYVDRDGNVITYSSSANRRVFEQQLETAVAKDEKLTEKIQTLNDSILNLETQAVAASSNSELASELGPLKYLSSLTGKSMDQIINILLLVIIFVFDPLAISLVVVANFAFKQAYKKEEPVLEEEIIDIPEKDWVEDWPGDNGEELERASLEDFNEEWEEVEPPNESLTEAAKQYNQTAPEPYQIYVSGSEEPRGATLEEQARHTDWEIIDEEKEHQKQELEDQMKELAEQAKKLQANPNYSSWKKKKDLEVLARQHKALESKRKALDDNDDLIIKYT